MHPDNLSDETATAQFLELKSAYDVLRWATYFWEFVDFTSYLPYHSYHISLIFQTASGSSSLRLSPERRQQAERIRPKTLSVPLSATATVWFQQVRLIVRQEITTLSRDWSTYWSQNPDVNARTTREERDKSSKEFLKSILKWTGIGVILVTAYNGGYLWDSWKSELLPFLIL